MPSPTITFRLPEEQESALNALSEVTGKPVAELVREGINRLLAAEDPDKLLAKLRESRKRQDEAVQEALRTAKQLTSRD